jgi:hypothetical protein
MTTPGKTLSSTPQKTSQHVLIGKVGRTAEQLETFRFTSSQTSVGAFVSRSLSMQPCPIGVMR